MKSKKKSPRAPAIRFEFSDGTYSDVDFVTALKRRDSQLSRVTSLLDAELDKYKENEAKELAGAKKGRATKKENVESNIRQAISHYKQLVKAHPQWSADVVYDEICRVMKLDRRTLDNYWKAAGSAKPRHPRIARKR